MFESLEGRVALITGASKGIGFGVAKQLYLKGGCDVVLTGRSEECLATAASALRELGGKGRVACFVGDVAVKSSCKAMVGFCETEFGRLDIVVANAGIYPRAFLGGEEEEEGEEDVLTSILNTNIKGTIWTIEAALPLLKRNAEGDGGARVIVISSITGPITGNEGFSFYAASKAAQMGFVKTAAVELAPLNITVNAILPGNVATEGLAALGEEYRAAMEQTIPMRRLGRVEDIGNAVCFLASREASYITGQSLVVDGGQVLPEAK